MARKDLFSTKTTPKETTAKNDAGGQAYEMSAKHQLAQFACTGTFGGTFYASGAKQLDDVKELLNQINDVEFLAKLAVYARRTGYMRDMPALILAKVSTMDSGLFGRALPHVIDNSRMLLTFLQILRSGQTGKKFLNRKCLKSVKRLMSSMKSGFYFNATGGDVSIQDAFRIIHPRPSDVKQNALWGYMMGREHDVSLLPIYIRQYEDFKAGKSDIVPGVNFQKVSALNLTDQNWIELFKGMPWNATKKNLNTALRHGIFKDKENVKMIADRLRDANQIKKLKVFPYEIFTAWKNVDENVPNQIINALQDALEISTHNIPNLGENVVVGCDISASMGSRVSPRSSVTCYDIASLISASILRTSENAIIIPFHERVEGVNSLNARDSIATNTQKIINLPSGGTNIAAPLEYILRNKIPVDTYIVVSDNESWIDPRYPGGYWGRPSGTAMMDLWNKIKRRNPKAKMININIVPGSKTSQSYDRNDILNVGGFSDKVFDVIASFTESGGTWVEKIEKTSFSA